MGKSRSWKNVAEGRDGEYRREKGKAISTYNSVTFLCLLVCYQASLSLWRITCELPNSTYFVNENAPLPRRGLSLKFWLLLGVGESMPYYFIFLPTFCVTRSISAVCTR